MPKFRSTLGGTTGGFISRPRRDGRARPRTLPTLIASLGALIGVCAIAGVASAQTIPSGGDFQSTPQTWTAAPLPGVLNAVSAAPASSGANSF